MLNKIDHSYFRIRNQRIKAICNLIGSLINRLRQWKSADKLLTVAFVKIGKRIQLSYLRTLESACPRKEEDAKHIATLQWIHGHLEKIERGDLTLEAFKRIYEERGDGDDAQAAEVRLNNRLHELGAFKKNFLRRILGA